MDVSIRAFEQDYNKLFFQIKYPSIKWIFKYSVTPKNKRYPKNIKICLLTKILTPFQPFLLRKGFLFFYFRANKKFFEPSANKYFFLL